MIRGEQVGKYRLTRRLGRGAMGEVWGAINIDTDREVALKLITSPDPELSRRLSREARAIGRLDHPNIVQILDRGETEQGEPFLVMQLLQGETLGDRLDREGRLPQAVAAGIALDISRALRVAHDKSIIHRDLKPANIFLHREPDTDEDVVKVVDFGVSKLSVENDGGATMNGGMIGSPAYMSPAQIRSAGVDGRSDIWALGVILFEMLSGRRPFLGPGSAAVLTQILSQEVPRVEDVAPHVDPALGDVVAACLERDAAKGIANATELARLLRPFVTRGRHATVEQPEPRERLASIPEAPPSAPAAADRESDASTAVFRPAMIAGVARAAHLRAQETGTVLLGGPAAARQGATAPADTPFVDESERATAEIVGAAAPAGAPTTAPMAPVRPPPPAPPQMLGPEPRVDLSRAGAMAPEVGSPFRLPSQPRAPGVTEQERTPDQQRRTQRGTQRLAAPAPRPPEPELSPFARPRSFKDTLPLAPKPAGAPPEPAQATGGGTIKLDPGAVAQIAAAIPPSWKPLPAGATTTATAPLMPLPAPAIVSDASIPETRRWPILLLGASLVMLIAVVTMLVVTLREDAGGPAPAPTRSAAPSGAR